MASLSPLSSLSSLTSLSFLSFLILLCFSTIQSGNVTHTFDFAQQMHASNRSLVIMFSMAWFGIPDTDPQGNGDDPTYGNWQWGGGCVATNNPATCSLYNGTMQRTIASYHRPLAGIYSSSGSTNESLARVDLMLSNVRRSCDDGAKIDAWAPQIDSLLFSSLHTKHPSKTADLAYKVFYF